MDAILAPGPGEASRAGGEARWSSVKICSDLVNIQPTGAEKTAFFEEEVTKFKLIIWLSY
jgi:hypothetical protein